MSALKLIDNLIDRFKPDIQSIPFNLSCVDTKIINILKSATDEDILTQYINTLNQYIRKSCNKTSFEILQNIIPTLLSFLQNKKFSLIFIQKY